MKRYLTALAVVACLAGYASVAEAKSIEERNSYSKESAVMGIGPQYREAVMGIGPQYLEVEGIGPQYLEGSETWGIPPQYRPVDPRSIKMGIPPQY